MDFNKYKNKVPWPNHVKHVDNAEIGRLFASGCEDEARKLINEAEESAREYDAGRAAYAAESARIDAMFYADCCKATGLDPESEVSSMLYARAYSESHSSGHADVYFTLVEYIDIIRDVDKIRGINPSI